MPRPLPPGQPRPQPPPGAQARHPDHHGAGAQEGAGEVTELLRLAGPDHGRVCGDHREARTCDVSPSGQEAGDCADLAPGELGNL